MPPLRWVIFDLDGTLTTSCVMEQIAIESGFDDVASTLASAYDAGRLSNADVSNEYARVFENRTRGEFDDILKGIKVVDHIDATIGVLKELGVRCGLATVTFDLIAEHFATRFGFDDVWCSTLDRADNGSYTGRVDEALEGVDKLIALEKLCADQGIEMRQIAYVGNGRSDIEAMQHCGLSIAFNADNAVRDTACLTIDAPSLRDCFHVDPGMEAARYRCTETESTCDHELDPQCPNGPLFLAVSPSA